MKGLIEDLSTLIVYYKKFKVGTAFNLSEKPGDLILVFTLKAKDL